MRNTRKVPENVLDLESVAIPSGILFDPKLTPRERLLYGILDSLCKKSEDGWTYASNVDLAKMLAFDPQIASNSIANLRRQGFIVVEYETGEDGRYEPYERAEYHSRYRRIRTVPQN